MLEANLRVRIPGCWVAGLTSGGRSVRIVDRKVVDGRTMESLFELDREERDGGWPEVVHDLRAHPQVTGVRAVASDDERLLGIVRCQNCNSCRALLNSNCFVTNILSRDGAVEWTVRFDDKRKLADLLRRLERTGVAVDIRRVSSVRGNSILTRRQAQVLRVALDSGYFDFPKGTGIEELARRLGVSKSTISEILHRAERKILRAYVEGR